MSIEHYAVGLYVLTLQEHKKRQPVLVRRDGDEHRLPLLESRLLACIVKRTRVHNTDILEYVWDDKDQPKDSKRSLDQVLKRLQTFLDPEHLEDYLTKDDGFIRLVKERIPCDSSGVIEHPGAQDDLREPHSEVGAESSLLSLLFAKTWEISAFHLATSIHPGRYAPDGTLNREVPATQSVIGATPTGRRLKFAEGLFVPPPETTRLDDFIASGQRALFIVGESGIGKTNLLCHYFLKLRQRNEPALFISARDLADSDLGVFLEARLLRRISRNATLAALDEELKRKHLRITVLLDAVNEYNRPSEGPLLLLSNLVAFVQDVNLFSEVRLVATCRREIWALYKQEKGSYPLDRSFFFPGDGDALSLNGFTEDRRKLLYSEYQKHYRLKPTAYDDLASMVKHLIQQPLLMSVIADTYDNRGKPNEIAG